MQSPKIDIHLPSTLPYSNWRQKICYWIGRLWSLCLFPLDLTQRVVEAAYARFTKDSAPPTHLKTMTPISQKKPEPSPPKEFKKNEKTEAKNEEEETLDLSLLFPEEVTPVSTQADIPQVQKPAIHSSPSIPEQKRESEQEVENEEKTNTEELQEFNLPPLKQEGKRTAPHPSKDNPVDRVDVNRSIKFHNFKRLRRTKNKEIDKKEEKNPSAQPLLQSTKPKTPPPPPPPQKTALKTPRINQTSERIFIDNPGNGDCQLHSILKGLELQYPEKMKYLEKGKSMTLTHGKLRQLGIDFIHKQIDEHGEYEEEVLGYLDFDRKEYNEFEVNSLKIDMENSLKSIEKAHNNKEMKENVYQIQIKAHKKKYEKRVNDLEKMMIRNDEEFIKRLEKSGFSCSSSHLFALSNLLEVPIYVKEQGGIKGHDTQMFNPKNSTSEPIYLYRVAKMHYQYILFPKS